MTSPSDLPVFRPPASPERPKAGSRLCVGWGLPTGLLLALLLLPFRLVAQEPATNRVLHFRGSDNLAEVPTEALRDLREITLEGWVRWARFRENSRFIELGRPRHCITLAASGSRPDLRYEIWEGRDRMASIEVPGILPRDRWCHVAAVAGPAGMRLYFNGMLVGSNSFAAGPADLDLRGPGSLGRSVWGRPDHQSLDGELDEVRIWNRARSGAEINATLLQFLTGREDGLVALWNFENGLRDAGRGGIHLTGARGVDTRIPDLALPSRVELPALVSGQIFDSSGQPLEPAVVQALDPDGVVVEDRVGGGLGGEAAARGRFVLGIRNIEDPVDLIVRTPHGTMEVPNLDLRRGVTLPLTLTLKEAGTRQSTNDFARWLGAQLKDPRRARRAAIAQLLRSLGPIAHEAGAPLVDLLRDPDPDVREKAFEALRNVRKLTPLQIASLIECLEHREPDVRAGADRILKSMDVPDSLEPYFMKTSQALTFVVAGLLISFALLHLVLFIFNTSAVSNLHYSILCATGTASTLVSEMAARLASQDGMLLPASRVLYFATLILALRLLYSLFARRLDRRFWVFCAYWPAFFVLGSFVRFLGSNLAFAIAGAVFFLVLISDMYRVVRRSRTQDQTGAWIITIGLTLLVVCQGVWGVRPALAPSLQGTIAATVLENLGDLGLALFVVANSLYLARQFGRTHRDLRVAKETLETQKTQLAYAKEAAEAANEAKSSFLANMSHELRTPLNAIIGYSEMLQEEEKDAGRSGMEPDLIKIQGAGRHLLGLINELLDLSKIEAGRMTLMVEPVDVARLVQETCSTLGPLLEKNRNRLELDLPATLGHALSDQTRLRQILLNLLSNAAKFTKDGRVTVRVRRVRSTGVPSMAADASLPGTPDSGMRPGDAGGEEYLLFQISDSGIGMTPEQLAKLFQPFTQADPNISREYGGTGLGLTICRKLSHLLQGQLRVASVAGRGSSFLLLLPAQPPLAPHGAVAPEPAG